MVWIAAGVALVIGTVIGIFFDRMRLGPAYRDKDQLLQEAKAEAENIRKKSELDSKEELLRRKDDINKELNKTAKSCGTRNANSTSASRGSMSSTIRSSRRSGCSRLSRAA
jgi:uncharacterized membrane-anchored protein YhcB (DUF1043 family)